MKQIDWNGIQNDFESEVKILLVTFSSEEIVDWFKMKIHRYDIFKAKRIKEQINYIRSIKEDSTRTKERKLELIESAEIILNNLIYKEFTIDSMCK